jgi:hypothetical protein
MKIPSYLWLGLVFALSACFPPRVSTQVLIPPAFEGGRELRDGIAVLPFDGEGGGGIARDIEGVLINYRLDEVPYFNVIGQSQIATALVEYGRTNGGVLDDAAVVRVGEVLKAKGVVLGRFSVAGRNDSYTEDRKEPNKPAYKINCIKRTAQFSLTPRVVSVSKGRTVFTRQYTNSATQSWCPDSKQPLQSLSELAAPVIQYTYREFLLSIAAHYETVYLDLIETSEGIQNADALKAFKSGLEFATKGQLERACELWKQSDTLNPNHFAIVYSLGVCAEATNNLEQALDLYKRAQSLSPKPEDKIKNALARVQERIRMRDAPK